jgi:hypothetical protein
MYNFYLESDKEIKVERRLKENILMDKMKTKTLIIQKTNIEILGITIKKKCNQMNLSRKKRSKSNKCFH